LVGGNLYHVRLNHGEFIPTYETFLNLIHPDDRDIIISAVEEAIHEKKEYSAEHRIVMPDDTVKYVHEQGEVIFDTDGNAVRMMGTILDITPLKLLEQKRTEAIQLAESSARLAMIGEVAGGITHEINQPLNAIKVTVDGILLWHRYNAGLVPEQFISMLGKISESADRISNIIKHMRAFWVTPDHRIEEVFNTNDVVMQALSLTTRQLNSHGIKTITKLSEPPPYITGNPLHIEQIVINLIHNAMNSLDCVSRNDKMLIVETLREDDSVQIVVTDNGIGLPEGIGGRLFDPFYSTRHPGEGMGLGLALVKRFVEEHKGFIKFGNNPSGGATFSIHFPISQASRLNNNEHSSC
jgi:C4-dicarboxylate-specific signal transduction histidine kinase